MRKFNVSYDRAFVKIIHPITKEHYKKELYHAIYFTGDHSSRGDCS